MNPPRPPAPPETPTPLSRPVLAALGTYFVLVWGAGFVATRLALQSAAPLTYIAVRYTIATGVALVAALAWRAPWPDSAAAWRRAALAGLATHAGYLAGSHYAQYWGLSAGVTALILALQPLVTAVVAARWMGERLTGLQRAGVVVGLGGVALVVGHHVDLGSMPLRGLVAVAASLACVTAGTLYQRRHGATVDLRTGVVVHLAATALVTAPLALLFEDFRITWNAPIAAALTYHVLLASIGAFTVLHVLMRHGQATRVTSLLYLTPPVAVLAEWLLFGTPPTALIVTGMVVVCAGVAMVTRRG